MEKALTYLFGSPRKLKILRLFYRNADLHFSLSDIERYTRLSKRAIKSELPHLLRTGVAGKKIRIGAMANKDKKLGKSTIFHANPEFPLFYELRTLLMRTDATLNKKLVGALARLGRVKLAVLSGFFINNPKSRVDLLLVGDNLDKRRLRAFFGSLEAETGKALSYSVMNSEEFRYRISMFDKFLGEIFELPHRKIVNKFNI